MTNSIEIVKVVAAGNAIEYEIHDHTNENLLQKKTVVV